LKTQKFLLIALLLVFGFVTGCASVLELKLPEKYKNQGQKLQEDPLAY
jgi:uncharacterized protein YceK